MKRRSSGFLDPRKCGDEVFDYVAELHEYLWRFVRAANPGASGMLTDLVDAAVLATEGKVNPGILPGVPYMDRALKAEQSVDRLTAEVARMQGERDAACEHRSSMRNQLDQHVDACKRAGERVPVVERERDAALDAEQRAHAASERECEAASKTIAALRASHEASEKECERLKGELAEVKDGMRRLIRTGNGAYDLVRDDRDRVAAERDAARARLKARGAG